MANRLPEWLAPNLITLTGLFALVLAYVVNAWYLPEFEGERRQGRLRWEGAPVPPSQAGAGPPGQAPGPCCKAQPG